MATGLYPWSTAESIMHVARRSEFPILPGSLQELAHEFESGMLNKFVCCDNTLLQDFVQVSNGKNLIFC